MKDFEASTYGDRIASHYDAFYGDSGTGSAISTLVDLASGGAVLELGIGTGRLALPLIELGLEVHGIDASAAMINELRSKPGGSSIPVTVGSFAEFDLGKSFSLVFVAFNTFFGLRNQEEQVSCFAAVARHLMPGGAFVIEAFVPDLSRFDRNQRVGVSEITSDQVIIDVSRHDRAAQQVASHHVAISAEGIALFPVLVRYSYPPELDLMARLAGLRLDVRWAGWDRSVFGAESGNHVSVYRPTA